MLRTDQLQLDLIINGDESRKKITELRQQAADLRKEMKGIKDQSLLGQKEQELKKIDAQIEDLYHSMGITNMSMKELAARSKTLASVLMQLDPNTEEWKAYKKELDAVNARHKELHDSTAAVGKNAKKSLSGFSLAGIVAGGMAAYNTVVSVFAGIKNGIMQSIEAYRAQEVAIQKVDQAVKQTGGAAGLSLKQLTDEATRLQNNTLFGDEQILNDATVQLLTFTNIAGTNFLKAQRAAMDLSTVLDGDLQSASIQLGKALNDPVSGLAALRKVGISFTDEQRKMIKELTETNRIEEAQAIILEEINRQYGGQAEAVAKGTGALKQAGIQIGDVAEAIGGVIGKIITPLAGFISSAAKGINEFLTPAMSAVESFEQQGRSVAVLVKDIDPLLDRYDQLKSKTNLSTSEQQELKKIIAQVAAVMPGAATAFDTYGNAIEISTGRVRQYIQGQVMLLRLENRKAIDETISDLADVNTQIEQSKSTIDQIAKTGTFKVFEPQSKMGAKTGGTAADIRDANQQEILQAQRHHQELLNNRMAYEAKLGNLRGDALQQSLNAYEAERTAAANASKEITDIRTMSSEELKALAEDGNDTQQKTAKEEIKRREELAKKGAEYARYMAKIAQELENARLQIIQDGRDKEIKTEELNYRRKLAEIKGNSESENTLRAALETEFLTRKAAIIRKYDDQERENTLKLEKQKWDARLKGLTEGSQQWFDVSQRMLAVQRELELSNVNLTEQQRNEIEERYRQMRENLNKKPDDTKTFADLDARHQAEWEATKMFLDRTGQMTIEKKREIAAQERDMALAEAEGNSEQQLLIWEQYYARLKDVNQEWLDVALQALSSLVNSFSAFDSALTAYEQAQLQRDQEANDQKKENLKRRLDAGLITQQQYDNSVARMDQELAEKKRKVAHDEAVRQKAISIVQAIINTAQAITAAMTVPYVGMALAIVAGVLGAAQVALIAATPIPEAAKGRYSVIGEQSKKRYRDVAFEESLTGIPGTPLLINETGDELVIDPATTKKLIREAPYVIETIRKAYNNELGESGGVGPELTKDAAGRITMSPDTLKYLQQNEPGVIDVINKAARSEPGQFGPVSRIPQYSVNGILLTDAGIITREKTIVEPGAVAGSIPGGQPGSISKEPTGVTGSSAGIRPGTAITESGMYNAPEPVVISPDFNIMESRVVMPGLEQGIPRMNYDAIIRGLKADRGVIATEPERIQRQPETPAAQEQSPVIIKDPELVEAIHDLQELVKKPLNAKISYEEMVKSTQIVGTIENEVSP